MKTSSSRWLLLPLFLLGLNAVQAQSYQLGPDADLPLITTPESDDFSIYEDEDPRIFYIDFETITAKIEEITVVNTSGEAVWEADVFALPGDAIYELSLHDLSPGRYEIELHMFGRVLKHSLRL